MGSVVKPIVSTAGRVAAGVFTLGATELLGVFDQKKPPKPSQPDVKLSSEEEEAAREAEAERERRRRARLTRTFTQPGALVPEQQVGRARLLGQ